MLAKHLLPIYEQKEPLDFADKQLKIFWLPDEVKVEKDIQDVLTNFTESEKHGVISVLKLFSLYETHAGDEYWGGRYKQMFEGAEFHRMASVFSMFELSIHAPFYNKINELLHLNDPEFYLSYDKSATLAARMKHLGDIIDHPDDLVSLAAFSMVEGVILYSSFAFLKHFQTQGKNRLLNMVRGINFSLRDENLHSMAGAWSFRHKLAGAQLTGEQQVALKTKIIEAAETIYAHERDIISMIFERGTIKGITALQLEHFVQSRINECLINLGYEKLYEVKHNPIAEWFYKAINDYTFNDFFSGISAEYHRSWDETAFVWKQEEMSIE